MTNYLITGANSFLGRTLVKHLCEDANNRILLITRGNIDFPEITGKSNIGHLQEIDLLDERCLSQLAEKCDSFFTGKLHTINCVGYYKGQEPFLNTSIAESKRIFDSNFTCVYNTANAIMPYLTRNNGGHFICFSCKSVKYKYPFMAPFSAAKAAIDCLVGSLANEFSEIGLVANSFSLSTVDTNYERKVKPYGDFDNWLKPEEVAFLVEKIITSGFDIMNGNTIDLFKYSESFFKNSYFDRIKK